MKMNNLLVAGFLMFSALGAKAQDVKTDTSNAAVTTLQQIEQDTANQETTKSDPLQLTHLYAGTYAVGTADQQSLETGKMSLAGNIRAGGRAVWKMSDKLSANALLAYDHSTGSDEQMLHLAAVDYTPVAGTKISTGRMASAATQMTDLPVKGGGHFLFTAEGDAVAPGLGVKVNQTIGDVTLAGSGMIREGGVEPSVWFNKGLLSGAVVLDPATKQLNGGVSYTGDLTNGASIFSMARLKPESLSLSAMYTTKDKIGFFIDGKYNRESKELDRLFVGVLKSMQQNNLGAKLGAGYEVATKSFQTVLFVTLGGERK